MIVVGIDPGITGAIALLYDSPGAGIQVVEVHDMPTNKRGVKGNKQEINAAAVVSLLRRWREAYEDTLAWAAAIEQVGAMPAGERSMGTASAFNFGESAGVLRGIVAALGIPHVPITPQAWRKAHGLTGIVKEQAKESSRAAVIRLYPSVDLHRKKDHARAEAILIGRTAILRMTMADKLDPDPFRLGA